MTPITRSLAALVATSTLVLTATAALPTSAAPASDEGPVTAVHSDPGRDLPGALLSYARLMALPSLDTGKQARSRAPRESGADDCPAPRCLDVEVPVPAGVRVSRSTTRVLLPTGYSAPRNAGRRYPVVLLLNGARSGYDGWSYKTELIEMSRRWQAIFVMPSGGQGVEAGMFTDWHDGSYDWETFHTEVVVPWVDRTFRTIRGARAVVGASMGGIGAISYAARHRGMFQAVLSISGAVDTTSMALGAAGPDTLDPLLGVSGPDLRRVWGDPVADRGNWNAHNPTKLVDRLEGVEVYVASGTGFSGDGGGIHSGIFERNLWNMHRTFLLALTSAGVPYRARVMVGGVHNWAYFNHPMRWAAPRLIAAALRSR